MDTRFYLKTFTFVFMVVLLACTAAGCGKKEVEKAKKVTAKEAWKVEQVSLKNDDFSLSSENFISNVSDLIYADNHLYYIVHPDDAAVEIQGISLDQPEKVDTYVSFPWEEEKSTRISYFQYNKDGSFTYLKEVSPQFEFDYLTQTDEEIMEASRKQLESVVTLETVFIDKDKDAVSLDVSDVLSGFTVMSCVGDGKERLYLSGFYTEIFDSGDVNFDEYTIILNMKSGKAEKMKLSMNDTNMITTGNGEVFDIISTGNKLVFRAWDEEKKEFSSKNKVVCEKSQQYGYMGCYAGLGDTILYLDNENLYQCDMKTKETELLLTLTDWDITGEEKLLVSAVDKDTLYVFSQISKYGSSGFDIGFFRLTTVDLSDLPEKTELVLSCRIADSYIKALAADFNRSNEKYRIKIEQLSEYEGPQIISSDDIEDSEPEVTEDVFYNTVMEGKAGDLILFSDLNGIVDNGELFEDLYPYIESDADLLKRSLNTNLLRLCELDGKLVTLPAIYHMEYLSCDSRLLGESPLTIDKFLEIIHENPDKTVLNGIPEHEILNKLFYYNIEYFIDFKEKTCRFTDGVFEKILLAADSFLNYYEMQQENAENGYVSDVFRIKQGTQLFLERYLSVDEAYQTAKALFGENCRIGGYPGIDKDKILAGIEGPLFAINKNSEYKEACFAFIKYVFENKLEEGGIFWFPADNDMLKEKIAEGIENTKDEELDMYDGTMLAVGALSEQDGEKIFEMANSVNTLFSSDVYIRGISEILDEEIKSFFEGRKTAEEVCTELDSKIGGFLQKREN